MSRDFEEPGAAGELTAKESARVERFLDGSLPGDERARLEEEILADPRLAEAVYSELNLRESIGGAADDLTRARSRGARIRPRPARWLRVALPAAALVVLAILAPRLLETGVESEGPAVPGEGRRLRSPSIPESSPSTGSPSPTPRPADAPASSGVVALFPAGSFDESPGFFKWTRDPAATSYRLEVRNGSGALVFFADTPDTSLPFPAAAMAPHAGADLSWRVVPAAPGALLPSSAPLRFRTNR